MSWAANLSLVFAASALPSGPSWDWLPPDILRPTSLKHIPIWKRKTFVKRLPMRPGVRRKSICRWFPHETPDRYGSSVYWHPIVLLLVVQYLREQYGRRVERGLQRRQHEIERILELLVMTASDIVLHLISLRGESAPPPIGQHS